MFYIREGKRLIGTALVALSLIAAGPAQAQCPGDCNGDGRTAINELIQCVNIALGQQPVSNCTACDTNGDGRASINELVQGVNAALKGCPDVASPTPTIPLDTPTPEPTETPVSLTCGDGTPDTGEECDDGKQCGAGGSFGDPCTVDADCGEGAGPGTCQTRDGDGCQSDCSLPTCGDGITDNQSGVCSDGTCVAPNPFDALSCLVDADCAGESCDDGNTDEGPGDGCPGNCRVAACTTSGATVSVDVTFSAPSGVLVAGLEYFVRYPDGLVSLPSSGFSSRLSSDTLPSITATDQRYGLDVVQLDSSLFGSESGVAMTIEFNTCEGADAPVAADFTCTLESASDTSLTTISDQVDCNVSL